MPVEHYTTAEIVAGLSQKPVTDVKPEWLEWADEAIEEYKGGGWKGATRTKRIRGTNTALLFLPSQAASITSIVYDTDVEVPSTDYELQDDGKTIERILGVPAFAADYISPEWPDTYSYRVTYVEPEVVPKAVERTATQLVNECLIWAQKYGKHGAATTSTLSGSAGSGSMAATTSFPDGLHETFQAILRANLGRGGGIA
jgi:hypothetical protein